MDRHEKCLLFLVGKPQRRKLERLKRGWEDSIQMTHRNCINVAEDRDQWWAVVSTVMKLSVP
jgi:hypothetical protein